MTLLKSRGILNKNGNRLKRLLIHNYYCCLIYKVADFKEILHLYSLTLVHNPRRNLYTPIIIDYRFCSFKVLSIFLFADFSAIELRLSYSFLPLHSPTCTFKIEPLKYTDRGIKARPS